MEERHEIGQELPESAMANAQHISGIPHESRHERWNALVCRRYDETEMSLLDRAQRGDGGALGELIWRQYPKLRGIAYRILGRQASADDVVLATLFKAVTKFGMFELRASFGAWLHRIVVNECIVTLRNQTKFGPAHFDESIHSAPNSANLHHLNPEDDLGTKELSQLVRLNIRHIPRLLRDPLLLRLEGYSYVEIGERLGITKAAAKSRMSRARQMLRERMLPHLPARYAGPGDHPRHSLLPAVRRDGVAVVPAVCDAEVAVR